MAFDTQSYETFGLSEKEGEGYKSFFIISFLTLLLSAFLGFCFLEKPLSLWSWDDPWFHFIPMSLIIVWAGIVFLLISPVQKALDIILSGFFAIFIWYKIFSSF